MAFKQVPSLALWHHFDVDEITLILEANLSICSCDKQAHVHCMVYDESWPLVMPTKSLHAVTCGLNRTGDVFSANWILGCA